MPDNSLLWRLSCALWGVEQHPWPLPTRCQKQPQVITTKSVSRHCHLCPLGGKITPSWEPLNTEMMDQKVRVLEYLVWWGCRFIRDWLFCLGKGRASLVAQMVKNLPTMCVDPLGQEDPPEKGMATLSNILAWKIPWTEEPGGLQSIGSYRVENNWATNYKNKESAGNVFKMFILSQQFSW